MIILRKLRINLIEYILYLRLLFDQWCQLKNFAKNFQDGEDAQDTRKRVEAGNCPKGSSKFEKEFLRSHFIESKDLKLAS